MLQLKKFEEEGTGGNCTALVARTAKYEYIITDGNLCAPEAFPVVLSIYNGYSECVYCAIIKDQETLEALQESPNESIEEYRKIAPESSLYEVTK